MQDAINSGAIDLSRVRLAEASDEEALMQAVQRMHAENEWGLRGADGKPLPFCRHRTRATIQRAIIPRRNDPGVAPAWIGVIPGDNGDIAGSIYLSVELPFCSESPFLAELWNYVFPNYRKSNNAKTLIAFSKTIASIIQIPLVIGVFTSERVMAKCRLYQRQLGEPSGQFFIYQGARGHNQ